MTADRIWLLKTGDGPVGQSEIGELDRANGTLNVINTRVRSAVPYGDGIIAVTWLPDGMSRIDSSGVHPIRSDALDAALIDKLGPDETIHDDGRAASGCPDITAKSIVWLDPATGAADVYALPVWLNVGPISCPPPGGCGPRGMFTDITATAVSPSGDLYFADATLNRVGKITRP